MKFKVGQMVRAKSDRWFNKGELLRIVEVDRLNELYRCKGTDKTYWQDESDLEPLISFQEKLDRFMKEPVGLLVKSKEISDGLAKVFEKNHMKPRGGRGIKGFMDIALGEAREYPGDAYVCYNVEGREGNLMCGTSDFTSEYGRELLDVTLDELKEYLESAEDFSDSEQEAHMKITIETDGHYKTTAECNGIITESLCNPTDEFKLSKGVHMAVQRLLERLEEPEGDTKFHMGDIVEVVDADGYSFYGEVKGVQGIVVSNYNEGVCKVKFPFVVNKKDTWYYYTQALKLIRRGDN